MCKNDCIVEFFHWSTTLRNPEIRWELYQWSAFMMKLELVTVVIIFWISSFLLRRHFFGNNVFFCIGTCRFQEKTYDLIYMLFWNIILRLFMCYIHCSDNSTSINEIRAHFPYKFTTANTSAGTKDAARPWETPFTKYTNPPWNA